MIPTQTQFGTVLVLWIAGLGAAAQFGKVSVSFQMLADHYGAAGPTLGFVVSLVGFVGIVFGVTAGLLVARIGYRRALIAALVLGALCSAYQSTLPPFALLLVSRAVEGASHLAIVVAAPTLIAQLSAPRHRGLTLSLWSTFFGVAFAVLVWFGLPIARAWGVGTLFATHAAFMGLVAGLVAWKLPQDVIGPSGNRLNLSDVLRDHLRIYRSPHLSAPGFGWVFYAGSFVAILTLMPPFLNPDIRDWVIGAMPLAGIACSMTLGVLMLRFLPAIPVVELGFAFCLVSCVLIWMNPTVAWPYLALAVSMGLVQGGSFAAVPQLNDIAQDQAQANGAMAQMGNIGTTAGTPILAAAIAVGGINGFLAFAGTLFSAGLLVHLWLGYRRRTANL